MLAGYIDLWCRKSLGRMQLHTVSGTERFESVQELRIDDLDAVFVDLGLGGTHQLLTKTKQGELIPMKAQELSQITIEHNPAIAGFLDQHAEKLYILPLSKGELDKRAEVLYSEDPVKICQFWIELTT